MGAILSAIAGPLLSALQSIAGPLIAYFTGRAQGVAVQKAEDTAAVAKIQAAEAVADAQAPRTVEDLVKDLRDPSKEF